MPEILINLRDSAPVDFELVAVSLDQKQPDFPEEVLPNYLSGLDIPYYVLEKDTYTPQLGDSKLFDFTNLRVERDTELHLPAIQAVNL